MMIPTQSNTFRFYGQLNRFLPKDKRYTTFSYTVKGTPGIKDTLQAIGVPHTEIDCIVVNGESVNFAFQLKGAGNIGVYPDAKRVPLTKIKKLKPRPPVNPGFILDAHLGKLCRHLRLLGFDTLYKKDYADKEIIQIVLREKRVLLTRDIGLLKSNAIQYGAFVREIDSYKQIKEIIKKYDLAGRIQPFRRCLECNGNIRRVAKSKIIDKLPPKTKRYYSEFYLCRCCGKIYWQGSHYEKLTKFLKKLTRF
jgi:uncharacterized protein